MDSSSTLPPASAAARQDHPAPERTDTELHGPHTGISARGPVVTGPLLLAAPLNSLLASTIFGTWHLLLFYAAWAVLITVLNQQGYNLSIQPTLLTAVGTVLGFVISYRTTSAYEKYNQGRMQWSRIIHACRTLARVVWFHVPELPVDTNDINIDEYRARIVIEKKTVLNLVEAAAVSVKHYLRGEEGIYYEDLYHRVHYLELQSFRGEPAEPHQTDEIGGGSLPLPVTAGQPGKVRHRKEDTEATVTPDGEVPRLHRSSTRPDLSIYDFVPVWFANRVRNATGRRAARTRARAKLYSHHKIYDNIPIEISLYLSSYIAHLQRRGGMDVPTMNTLFAAVNTFVDSLTDLERISTTPIPYSYSSHLWIVTTLYCLVLPFQIYDALGWVTIPGTIVISYFFFGFLVAGEEIENPFGYDINDLNLDNFTHNIIRKELKTVTSRPPPSIQDWVFHEENKVFMSKKRWKQESANHWAGLGYDEMWSTLKSTSSGKAQPPSLSQSPSTHTKPPPASSS